MSHRLLYLLVGLVLLAAALTPFVVSSRSVATSPAAMVATPVDGGPASDCCAQKAKMDGQCDMAKGEGCSEKAASKEAGGYACPFSKPAAGE